MGSKRAASFLTCMLALVVLATESGANRRATYGEPCSRTVRCDSRSSLTCSKGVCSCALADTMRLDRDSGRCAVIPGEKCVFTAVEAGSGGASVIISDERSWREEMPCVADASCLDGFCTCHPGFYESGNSTCVKKRGYGEDCEVESSSCMNEQGLVCSPSSGLCTCNSTHSVYETSRHMCVVKAGQSCDQYTSYCVSHSHCLGGTDSGNQLSLSCQCEAGYFGDPSDGKCHRRRSHGEPCTADNNCLHEDYLQLVCNSSGRCECNSTSSVYDRSNNMCRRKAGASCHGFPYCVENSECGRNYYSSHNEYSYGSVGAFPDVKCDCTGGFFASPSNGTCILKRGFGERCESDDNCGDELNCVGGACECDESVRVHDPSRRKCVGLANSVCEGHDDCVENSECNWTSGDDDDNKRCVCEQGYSNSSKGTCLASHSSACADHWTTRCNEEQGLVCFEGTCACKYSEYQRFDETTLLCVSNVLGPCSDSIPCVSNSRCVAETGGIRRCQCNSGFVPVGTKCQLAFGQPCAYPREASRVKCDELATLHCIDGVCQCRDSFQVYDKDSMKCFGLVGSFCNVTAGECVTGARCVKRRFQESSLGTCECQTGWTQTPLFTCDPAAASGSRRHQTHVAYSDERAFLSI